MAHSDSWGQDQIGALIGPVMAPNTPLWSALTAIGWLFISNRIAVDPLAEGLQFLFFFFTGCTFAVNPGHWLGRCSKCIQKPQSTWTYRNWGNIPPHHVLDCTTFGLIVSFRRLQLWKPWTQQKGKYQSIHLLELHWMYCLLPWREISNHPLNFPLTERHRVFPVHVYSSAPKVALWCMLTCWENVKLVSSYEGHTLKMLADIHGSWAGRAGRAGEHV